MQIMGTNRWEFEVDKDFLIKQALDFADDVREQGIAQLIGAWISPEHKLLWCAWETENEDGLHKAFDDLNARTGLKSELTPIETMFPV